MKLNYMRLILSKFSTCFFLSYFTAYKKINDYIKQKNAINKLIKARYIFYEFTIINSYKAIEIFRVIYEGEY